MDGGAHGQRSRPQSIGSQRVQDDWNDLASMHSEYYKSNTEYAKINQIYPEIKNTTIETKTWPYWLTKYVNTTLKD